MTDGKAAWIFEEAGAETTWRWRVIEDGRVLKDGTPGLLTLGAAIGDAMGHGFDVCGDRWEISPRADANKTVPPQRR
jgi:hypothetical protein